MNWKSWVGLLLLIVGLIIKVQTEETNIELLGSFILGAGFGLLISQINFKTK